MVNPQQNVMQRKCVAGLTGVMKRDTMNNKGCYFVSFASFAVKTN
jgi:hypothetical protein